VALIFFKISMKSLTR